MCPGELKYSQTLSMGAFMVAWIVIGCLSIILF
jgi:hypothetical protein